LMVLLANQGLLRAHLQLWPWDMATDQFGCGEATRRSYP
jgi:hypothetical protein